MAWFLFVDESGHDRRAAPYEGLAGFTVQDRDFWNLINALHAAEFHRCDRRYSAARNEINGRTILKTKILSHSNPNAKISPGEVQNLAKSALDSGEIASARGLKALALAKLNYVGEVFDICAKCRF